MKKAILLTSIIASMTTMANVTGFIEGNCDGEVRFNKTFVDGDIKDLSVKGEVKVNRFTLGAVLANKDLKGISKENPLTTEKYTDNLLDHSSVYAKYELPEFSGIKSYVKGTLNPKAPTEDGKHNFKKGNVELEGQLAHSFNNGVEVSLTSKTKFPFEKKDGEYGKGVESEHVLKVAAKKLNKFEDLEASLKLNHTYAKEKAFKFVDLSAKGTYAGLKDTKLTGKANFRYQVNGTSDVKDLLTDGQIKLNKDAYAHSYELDGKYTGIKDLELTAGAFVQHVHYNKAHLDDYMLNPYEGLVVSSLIDSFDLDSFNEYMIKYKKEYMKALKELEEVSESDREEYEILKKKYEEWAENYEKELQNNVNEAKKLYNETDIESKKNYDFVMKQEDLKYEGRHLADLIEILKKKKKEKPWIFNKKYYDDKIDEYTKRIEEINVLMLKKGDFENNGHKLANIECDLIDFRKDKNVLSAKTKKEFDKLMQRGGQVIPSEIIRDIIIKIYRNKYQIALFKLNEIKERHYTYMYNRIKKDPKEFFARHDMINFGFKLATEYKGIKNLKLTADGLFGGRHHFEYDRELKYPAYTMGYVKLHAGAKYDFKLLNDKLVVSPEGNITATFADIYAGICNPSLVLAPKVSLEYKPIEELKVKGSIEVPVKFGLNEFREFGYKNTGIKGTLNMRYEWK